FVIQGARKNAGSRRLPNATYTGQHVAMGDAAGSKGISQRLDGCFLPDEIVERLRPVFARENDVWLRRRVLARARFRIDRFFCRHRVAHQFEVFWLRLLAPKARRPGEAMRDGSKWRRQLRPAITISVRSSGPERLTNDP